MGEPMTKQPSAMDEREYSDDAGRSGYDEPNDDFEICNKCGELYLPHKSHTCQRGEK